MATVPTVVFPSIPGFTNLIVFPFSSSKKDESKFFLLKKSADVPWWFSEVWEVEYLPGFIYCLLPSNEETLGVAVYTRKPNFLDDFSYCFEIDQKAIMVKTHNSEAVDEDKTEELSEDARSVEIISELCDGCFKTHFPRPNRSKCIWNKKKRVSQNPVTKSLRLRGGAGPTNGGNEIITRAVANAAAHGINIHAGVKNLANGNCLFESVIDSINTRDSFLKKVEGSPDFWRKTWLKEVEDIAFKKWPYGMTNSEWREAWSALKMPRVYETELGDIVLPCIAHCVKKDVLVFNTSSNAHYAVYVIESSMLDGQANETEIPICLAYDQTHYEPLVPNTEEDILETINLKKSIIDGSYKDKRNEIAFLTTESSSYAKAVKRGLYSVSGSSKSEHWVERKVMEEVGNKKQKESFKYKVTKTDDPIKKR